LTDIARKIRAVDDRRKFFVAPLNAHVKQINEFFASVVNPYKEAEATLRKSIATFRREESRLAAEEARRADEARRAAEDTRRKAEMMRLALECKAKEAAEKGQSTVAEKLLETAALQQAKASEAESAIQDAVPACAPPPTGKGVSSRTVAKWRVVDESVVPREYLRLDEKKIGEAVRAGTSGIPGIEIYAENIMVIR
jgi:membrane protein involved in colicin uptake